MSSDLGAEIDRLYSLPLDEFTGARNDLVRDLKKQKRSDDAARIAALRKPTLSAWAVNQAVRAEPGRLDSLLGAGGELRQAHRQAARGAGAEQLRAAARAERDAVEELAAAARKAAGRRAGEPFMDRVRETLHATSLDDDARKAVCAGRLTEDVSVAGLGPFDFGSAGAERQEPRSVLTARTGDRALVAELRRLRREADAAERAVAAAEAKVENAREALGEARAGLAEQKAKRKRLQAELKAAEKKAAG